MTAPKIALAPCGHGTHMRRASTVYGWVPDVDEWEQCVRVPATRSIPTAWNRKQPEVPTPPVERPAAPLPPNPDFLTVAEVAKMLRVSNMSVYRLCHSGDLDSVRVGRSFRIPSSGVGKYLEWAR